MEGLKLYRKRIIPAECVFLKDDFLLYRDSDVIVTRWRTLRPKKTLSHGYSCYFPERGFKVSKFYDHEDRLISWYCDIIQTDHRQHTTVTGTAVNSNVIIFPEDTVIHLFSQITPDIACRRMACHQIFVRKINLFIIAP